MVPKQITAIVENLQLNLDIISYANAGRIQAAVVALGQEKIFDRKDVHPLFKALKYLENGPEIIQKNKTVY